MEEIINQYGKIIITIVAIAAMVLVVTFLIKGDGSSVGDSVVAKLFQNMLNAFAGKAGLEL